MDLGHPTSFNGSNHSGARVEDDARRFLLDNPMDLRIVCELAGVNAALMRHAAEQMVSGHLAYYIRSTGKFMGKGQNGKKAPKKARSKDARTAELEAQPEAL
jgi:hypothetical protein